MFKWIKRIVLAVVVLIVLILIGVYLSINSILRAAIQSQANASLNVPTTLGSAHISIFGGEIGLNDLEIGSPQGFSAPHMFTLGGTTVDVNYGQLSSEPIHILKIVIDSPVLVLEQASGKLNVQALNSQPSQTPAPSSNGQPSQPMKLIIDELDLNNAQVNFQPGIPGLANSIQIPIPSLTMKNIGNADGSGNGAAIKDVVTQVTTALASKAASSGKLPFDANQFINGSVSSMSNEVGNLIDKKLGTTQSGEQIQSELNGLLKRK